MVRVVVLLNLCLVASSSPFEWRHKPTPAPAVRSEDDSIVYHDENNFRNDRHITVILNNDSNDDSDRESNLDVFRVVMDIVMKRELKTQQNPDLSATTYSVLNNEIENNEQPKTSSPRDPIPPLTWPWSFKDTTTANRTTTTPTAPAPNTTPAPTTAEPPKPTPSPGRCRWCECWERCRQRRYNWGMCLCGKCHCYY